MTGEGPRHRTTAVSFFSLGVMPHHDAPSAGPQVGRIRELGDRAAADSSGMQSRGRLGMSRAGPFLVSLRPLPRQNPVARLGRRKVWLELVKGLKELVEKPVEDRRNQQHSFDCGQDVDEEQAQ